MHSRVNKYKKVSTVKQNKEQLLLKLHIFKMEVVWTHFYTEPRHNYQYQMDQYFTKINSRHHTSGNLSTSLPVQLHSDLVNIQEGCKLKNI